MKDSSGNGLPNVKGAALTGQRAARCSLGVILVSLKQAGPLHVQDDSDRSAMSYASRGDPEQALAARVVTVAGHGQSSFISAAPRLRRLSQVVFHVQHH